MPVSIFGCGVSLYQERHLNRCTLFGFKVLKYIGVLIGIIILTIGFVPYLLAQQLHEEDKKWFKRRIRRGKSESVLWDSPSGVFITQTMRNFVILQGVFVGIVCDIVATPILLALSVIGIIAGTPIMFYIEWSERQKIHGKATRRLRNILTRNEKLYHGVYNEEQFF